MNILFLGPECEKIEKHLLSQGHNIERIEGKLDKTYFINKHFDFCISYRYRYILKKDIIDIFDKNIINLHISYLPWNRGSDPNLWSFLEDTQKGVTIHILSEKLDKGDILLQKELFFSDNETLSSTYQILSDTIENLFNTHSNDLLNNKIEAYPQKENGSYHCIKDKEPFLHLIEKKSWETPIKELIGAAKK